jgi:hypothetical protein
LKVRFDSQREGSGTQEVVATTTEGTSTNKDDDLRNNLAPATKPVDHTSALTETRVKLDREDSGSDTDVPPFRLSALRSKIRLVDASGVEIKPASASPVSATPLPNSPIPGLPPEPIAFVNRLKEKIADIRSEFPPTPNQYVLLLL